MNKASNFEVDASEVLNLFKDLSYRKQISTYKKSLRKSANIIAKETRKLLKADLGKSATHLGKYGAMSKGIKVRVYKNGKLAKIHIMGDFRLKWFEKGTAQRYRRTNYGKASTGKIKSYYFFRSANNKTKRNAEDSLIKNLAEAIIKINNKNK